jgi:hypothetical protein
MTEKSISGLALAASAIVAGEITRRLGRAEA